MKNITKIIIATLAICTIVSCNKIPQEKHTFPDDVISVAEVWTSVLLGSSWLSR